MRHCLHHLNEVGLRHAVREANPAARGGARRLDRENLDHRDSLACERGRLAPPDEPASEDDGDVGFQTVDILERSCAELDVETRVFEQLREVRLPSGEDEYAAVVLRHGGMVPGSSSFQPSGTEMAMKAQKLDHVALWVADRDAIAAEATSSLGMHVIERSARFTLVGSDARRGKLTLFAADGPRERGLLKHVALRVSDLERAAEVLSRDLAVESEGGGLYVDLSEGLRVGLVPAPTDVEYDLDHVALFSAHPEETARAYTALGFRPVPVGRNGAPRVEVGGAFVEFHEGEVAHSERPLLNHLAVLVASAQDHIDRAHELGLDVADVVDAANTYAVFVWGPERVKIEYVEHKPTFSLV